MKIGASALGGGTTTMNSKNGERSDQKNGRFEKEYQKPEMKHDYRKKLAPIDNGSTGKAQIRVAFC